eukprot:TRINITY_DN850_c0_g1_i2.p1 TRINITY_DN850_c0_g1~~TRINITY_DN850_c0_g1_i2.p1  ORF type:complete len:1344 (-),score=342.53 TRINITY_DN850_c0_g1_i2:41-4072(-)
MSEFWLHAVGNNNYVASVQNANTRKRLLSETKAAIKQLLMVSFEDSGGSVQNEAVVGICKCLEDTLKFGLKSKIKSFFSFIQYIDHYPKGKEGIEVVKTLSEVHTDEGRGRAWLRRCLATSELPDFFTILINNSDHVRVHYEDFALYSQHEEKNIFLSLLMGLSEIHLKVSYNERALDWSFDPSAKEPTNLPSITQPPMISQDTAVIVVNENEVKEKSQGKKKKRIKKKVALIESLDNDGDNDNDVQPDVPTTKQRSDSSFEQKPIESEEKPVPTIPEPTPTTNTPPPTIPTNSPPTPIISTPESPSPIVHNVNTSSVTTPTLEDNNNNNNVNTNIDTINNINTPTTPRTPTPTSEILSPENNVSNSNNNSNIVNNVSTPPPSRVRPNKPLPSKPLPPPPPQTKTNDPTTSTNTTTDVTKTTIEGNSNVKTNEANANTLTSIESNHPQAEVVIAAEKEVRESFSSTSPIKQSVNAEEGETLVKSDNGEKVENLDTKAENGSEDVMSSLPSYCYIPGLSTEVPDTPQSTPSTESSSLSISNSNNTTNDNTTPTEQPISSPRLTLEDSGSVPDQNAVEQENQTKVSEIEVKVGEEKVGSEENEKTEVENASDDVMSSLPSYCYIPGLSTEIEPEPEVSPVAAILPQVSTSPKSYQTILPPTFVVTESKAQETKVKDEITSSGNDVNQPSREISVSVSLEVPLIIENGVNKDSQLGVSIGTSTSSLELGVSFDSVSVLSSHAAPIHDLLHDQEDEFHTTTVDGKHVILDGASVEYADSIPDLDSALLSLSRSIEDLTDLDNFDDSISSNSVDIKSNGSHHTLTKTPSIEFVTAPSDNSPLRTAFLELHQTFTPPASPRDPQLLDYSKPDTAVSPQFNNGHLNHNEKSTSRSSGEFESTRAKPVSDTTSSPHHLAPVIASFVRSPDNSSTVISNPPSPNPVHEKPPLDPAFSPQATPPQQIETKADVNGVVNAPRKSSWKTSSSPPSHSTLGKSPDKESNNGNTTEKYRHSIVISETRKMGEKEQQALATKSVNGNDKESQRSSVSINTPPSSQKSSPVPVTKQSDAGNSSKRIIPKENDSLRSLKEPAKIWSPPRNRVYFNIHNPGKPQDQDYLCSGCGNEFSFGLFSTIRYCEYTGKLYCGKCHVGDSFFIPARVLHDWDHRAFPVSKHAKAFLEKSYREPLFDVLAINPALYKKSQSIASIRILRKQLFFLRDFIMTCSRSTLWKDLGLDAHPYLATDIHMYSLRDLINATDLLENMRSIVEKMFVHIKECELCKAKGSYCEFCSSREIIYPFQLSLAIQCVGECKGVFHRKCYNKSKCPKCLRIAKRKMMGTLQEQKSVMIKQ